MTWIKFLFWLSGIYSFYYVILFLLDSDRTLSGRSDNDRYPELTFSGDFKPLKLQPALTSGSIASPVLTSGGVSLKQLFSLAQEEAVEFTRKVSF